MLTIQPVALVAAHQGLLDALIAEGTPHAQVLDATDTLLVDLPLGSGSINTSTGQLTIWWGQGQLGAQSGTAANLDVMDAADVPFMRLSISEGTTPVADEAVMSDTDVVAGYPVSGVSFTIG